MHTGINELMIMQNLVHHGHVVTYFPLHNEYDLKGFDRRREKEGASAGLNRKERAEKAGLSKIQTLFKEMLGEAYNFVEEK